MRDTESRKRGREDEKREGHVEDTTSFPATKRASFVLVRKGCLSRQPEGVTPAYSYAGSGERRKRRTRNTSVLLRTGSCPNDNVAANPWKMNIRPRKVLSNLTPGDDPKSNEIIGESTP